jgi:SPP1 family predicted phage head-tail adaptor
MPRRTEPGIDAGTLDKRVTLLAPVYNEFEDEIVDWRPVEEVWAGINANYGREQESSGRTIALTDLPLTIRYRSDVDKRWRVQFGGRLFDINGILNTLERNERLTLLCQEVE